MKVRAINVFGDGRLKSLELEEGATVQDVLRIEGIELDKAVIRVNGQPASPDAPLSEDDRVSITPTKMAGAAR